MKMNIKIIIFLLLLLMKFGLNTQPDQDIPKLGEKMVKLLFTCFGNRLNTIIATSNLSGVFRKISSEFGLPPMILIDENSKLNVNQKPVLHSSTFVFAPNSVNSLTSLLRKVKSSPWWNIKSLFFIVGNLKDGCRVATDILNLIWEMNLLSSIYLCYERDNGLMLFTYNPYENRAPLPWKEVKDVLKPDDIWTLYKQPYFTGMEYCSTLNFDKTKFMDGYEINVVANSKPGVNVIKGSSYSLSSLSDMQPSKPIAILLQTLFQAMKLTAKVTYPSTGSFSGAEGDPKANSRRIEIYLSARELNQRMSGTYPRFQMAPRIITQQRNFLTPEEKISAFYSTEIKYLTGIVLLITFVFILLIIKKKDFAFAAFDVLRLLLSAGLFVPLNRTPTRIFIFCVFQLIIILNATFQGNISAFLTKPERHYVDNLQDLEKYQYTLISPYSFKNYLREYQTSLPTVKYVDSCIDYLLKNSSLACIEAVTNLLEPAFEQNLHISRSELNKQYLYFQCQQDWPLKKNFDHYMARLIEAGLYEYLYNHNVNIPVKKLQSREEKETSAQFRSIKLADLLFAFFFFAIGIGISIIVFIIEKFLWYKFLRALKKMKENYGKHS